MFDYKFLVEIAGIMLAATYVAGYFLLKNYFEWKRIAHQLKSWNDELSEELKVIKGEKDSED